MKTKIPVTRDESGRLQPSKYVNESTPIHRDATFRYNRHGQATGVSHGAPYAVINIRPVREE